MKKVSPRNTIYKKPNSILLYFTVLFVLVSCSAKKSFPQENTLQKTHSKILFLNYTITKKSSSDIQIDFINKIISSGKLKANNNKYHNTGKIGDLTCVQLDKNENLIQRIAIDNPLSKTIEFVNDSLNFEKRKVQLNRSPLSLRLQLDERATHIVINQIIDSLQNSKELIKTALD